MPLFQPSSDTQPGKMLRHDPGLALIVCLLASMALFGLWRIFEWGGASFLA